jgi:hypothetical protein
LYFHYRIQDHTRQRAFVSDFVGKDVFAECQKALGKEKHSAKCKSEKIQKKETGKKFIGGGMHIFFSNFS